MPISQAFLIITEPHVQCPLVAQERNHRGRLGYTGEGLELKAMEEKSLVLNMFPQHYIYIIPIIHHNIS